MTTTYGIPIRNLWLLMLYASDLYRHLGAARTGAEENPDEIPELVARVLADLVERRLRRNLCAGYVARERTLDRVRGRIDVLKTTRGRLLERGRVACRYEELTLDTPRNRYVRAALDSLVRSVRTPEVARRCRVLAGTMGAMGVAAGRPTDAEALGPRLGAHEKGDAPMIAAARLAFDLALPTEAAGVRALLAPDCDETWLRKLFERAVGGLYGVALEPGWRVSTGDVLHWPVETASLGLAMILPEMRLDIRLEHPATGRRLIVDTKFTRMLHANKYGQERMKSEYLYQIFVYVRAFAPETIGVLLHPSVGLDLFECGTIQGHELRFVTVDLTGSASAIRARILAAVVHSPLSFDKSQSCG